MRIYAIRDRMLDYFLTPFASRTDKEVLGGIAAGINNGDSKDALAQTPHHFEVWCIGEVLEDGSIVAAKVLIADCGSLVRPGRPSAESGGGPYQEASGGRRGPQGGDGGKSRPRTAATENAALAGSRADEEIRP